MANKKSLPAPRLNAFAYDPDKLVIIGFDTDADADADHPLADAARLKLPIEEGLVLNIMRYGVIEPVIVRRDGDRALVVDGRRRVRHAREAAKRQRAAGEEPVMVPVIVRKADDTTIMGVARSANEHRKDDDPMARADAAARLVGQNMPIAEVAIIYGVHERTIRSWLALTEVAPPVRKAVSAGEISGTAAARMAGLPRDEQITMLAEVVASGGGADDAKPSKAKDRNEILKDVAKRKAANAGKATSEASTATAGAGATRGVKPIKKAIIRLSEHCKGAHKAEVLAAIDALNWALGATLEDHDNLIGALLRGDK